MDPFASAVASEFLGGVAAEVTTALMKAVGRKVRRKFEPPVARSDLDRAMARALDALAKKHFAGDEANREHFLRIYTAWLAREEVADEMAILLDPAAAPDTAALEASYDALQFPAEWLARRVPFQAVLGDFVDAFRKQAEKSAELGRQIALHRLKDIAAGIRALGATQEVIRDNVTRLAEKVAPDLSPLWQTYFERICDDCGSLALLGLDIKTADAATCATDRMRLADVYVVLDTTARTEDKRQREPNKPRVRLGPEEDTRPLAALEALVRHTPVVLVGDPGSGKSTFVNHLCLCLARYRTGSGEDWRDRLAGWPEKWRDIVPLPIVLREVAAWLGGRKGRPHGSSGLFLDYLRQLLARQGIAGIAGEFEALLHAGGCLLLIDGLDEISAEGDILEAVKAMIVDVQKTFRRCPVLVTCRVMSYEDPHWRIDAAPWRKFELARLDKEKIDWFIDAWYRQLAALAVVSDPAAMRGKLAGAVRRPDLWRMAGNPLLLTVMALVHTHKGELPDARALLYEEVVDILLWRWEAVNLRLKDDKETGLRQLMRQAGLSDIDLKQALWELAFEAHGQMKPDGEKEEIADIDEIALLKALRRLHPQNDLGWAESMVQIMKLRAGLIPEKKPGTYSFPHRTFQEYLAACHLGNLPDFVDTTFNLSGQAAFWREVILLATGRLVYHGGDLGKPLLLIDRLCPGADPPLDDAAAWRRVWLAGLCYMEFGPERAARVELAAPLKPRLQERLVTLVSNGLLSPRERAEAGVVLGTLGDTRSGVGVQEGLPDIDWIEVPAGPFVMGSDKAVDKEAYDDELPQFECRLIQRPYRIARYPVTVAQYALFTAAGGYGARRYWTDAGWRWREEEKIDGPEAWGERFETPNHPQVGVSWYEAMAYCNWLAGKLGFAVTLPTESQWERAARHTDGRIYPWGAEFVEGNCNSHEAGVGATSAVGIFPSGKAQCGAMDMAGNVWEWCRSRWLEDYKDYEAKAKDLDVVEGDAARVLRGGCFLNYRWVVRCAVRSGGSPDLRDFGAGFRPAAPGL